MVEQRPPGHFDRFNFCNSTPDYHADVTFTLMGGPPAGPPMPVAPGLAVNEAYCVPPITVNGFSADVSVDGPGGHFDYHFEYPGGMPLKQIVIGIAQSCGDDAAVPPEPALPVPFGLVYSEEGGPQYQLVTDITQL